MGADKITLDTIVKGVSNKIQKGYLLSYLYVSFKYKPWPWSKEEEVLARGFNLVYADNLKDAENKLTEKYSKYKITKIKNLTIE